MCERMNQTVQHECTNKLIFIGEDSLRRALRQFQLHYNSERPHQGIENRIPEHPESDFLGSGDIHTKERLGGLLKYYYRSAV